MARPQRILIVEDNQDLAFGLKTNMEVQGYEAILAADGPKGLDLALADPPNKGSRPSPRCRVLKAQLR